MWACFTPVYKMSVKQSSLWTLANDKTQQFNLTPYFVCEESSSKIWYVWTFAITSRRMIWNWFQVQEVKRFMGVEVHQGGVKKY